ncbi:hypothetical protein PDR5_46630 [Pseudomonas sp. DR 5-09]|nr:hypothetical protein PDR5_46630 [Pseudomonas sp. DR 5-09]
MSGLRTHDAIPVCSRTFVIGSILFPSSHACAQADGVVQLLEHSCRGATSPVAV